MWAEETRHGTFGLDTHGAAGAGARAESLSCRDRRRQGRPVARKKLHPVSVEEARQVGVLLRNLRRAAGFRAVHEAAARPGCPAASQTIYAYERGGLVPSLAQFLDLVEFYALTSEPGPDAKATEDLRAQAVAAVVTSLTLRCYHVSEAMRLISRLQTRG